jgi:hypothetical protein
MQSKVDLGSCRTGLAVVLGGVARCDRRCRKEFGIDYD